MARARSARSTAFCAWIINNSSRATHTHGLPRYWQKLLRDPCDFAPGALTGAQHMSALDIREPSTESSREACACHCVNHISRHARLFLRLCSSSNFPYWNIFAEILHCLIHDVWSKRWKDCLQPFLGVSSFINNLSYCWEDRGNFPFTTIFVLFILKVGCSGMLV